MIAERKDTMHFRVTSREQAQLLVNRMCADMAQGKIRRSTIRKVYIQRTAFTNDKLVRLLGKTFRLCKTWCGKWFRLWLSYLKPEGNGAVVSVGVLALAGILAISFCSLNGQKRRLQAEKNQLVAENAQLNTDVDSLKETVDEITDINKEQEQIISDQEDKLGNIEKEQADAYEKWFEDLVNSDLLQGFISRSASQSAATSQIAQVKDAVQALLGEVNPEKTEELLTALTKEEERVNWYYNHKPDFYPTYGTFTSAFGWRLDPVTKDHTGFHDGVDIANSVGTPIYAAGAGKVILAGQNSGYGLCVVIDHGNGIRTLYAHMSKVLVSVGDEVSKAERIGLMGATGRVTGPHLHFEVIVDGVKKDPMKYVG